MQYRPKLWIALLVALLVVSFEVGFQPIRFIRSQQSTAATVDFDLGQQAAPSDEALKGKLAEIRKQLEDAGLKAIKEVRFVNRSTLQVTTTALEESQRTTDKALALSTLQKEFRQAKAIEGTPAVGATAGIVARLGPIGVFRPVPQVRLGLDLQGGAHVVLQCKPSTEMTFATPEDRPMFVEKTEEGETAPEPAAEETKSETKAEGKAGETKEAAPGETKAQAESEKGTGEAKEAAPAGPWKPKETKETLLANLEKLLQAQGTKHFEVSAPAPYRVLIRTQSTSEEQVRKEHAAILGWLQQTYAGAKIDAPEPSSVFVSRDTAAKAQHIIDLRLFSMSDIKEPLVQTQGADRIIVELPGVKEPERVTSILQSTAQLEFRLAPERYTPVAAEEDNYDYWEDKQTGGQVPEDRVLSESPVEFTGSDLKPNAQVQASDKPGTFEVRFEIKETRKRDFAEFTRNNVGRIMSIVLDKSTKMAPVIRSEIPGTGVISGSMDAQKAGDLRLLLNAGALPVPLEIVENRQVSATLGADSIRKSVVAGGLGLVLVALFMVAYYRLPGILADLALLLYLLILMAALSTWSPLQATLTLPGIAGIILSIGMAVDANVIIFERLKEELRHRTTTRAAAEAGFHRAWTAILDANVTTMMVCSALYFLGTSAVKSFAVSLFLGVVVSLLTAVTVSRWLVLMAARSRFGDNRWLFGVEGLDQIVAEPAGGSE